MGVKHWKVTCVQKKHVEKEKIRSTNRTIPDAKSNSISFTNPAGTCTTLGIPEKPPDITKESKCSLACPTHCRSNDSPSKSTLKTRANLSNFVEKDDVTKAEITWCLKAVQNHNSLRDIENSVDAMRILFPDSEIAKKMQLSKAKALYIITFGLDKYFRCKLLDAIDKSDFVSVAFDESLNKITEKQQMDFIVRYWDTEKNEVDTRYLTSAFLGRATEFDRLQAFENNIPSGIMKKTIQISMDGPNVNLKFLREMKDKKAKVPDDKKLLDL